MEPGDGTGCSLQDAKVRNEKGLCAIQGCGKVCDGGYGFLNVKLCNPHSDEIKKLITDWDALMEEATRYVDNINERIP